MDELERYEILVAGQVLEVYGMKEIVVDGIPSSWQDSKGYATTYEQPMIEFKNDMDAGQPMHVKQDFVVDEEAWLRTGRIRNKY